MVNYSNYMIFIVNMPWNCGGMIQCHTRTLSFNPLIPYLHVLYNSFTVGLEIMIF